MKKLLFLITLVTWSGIGYGQSISSEYKELVQQLIIDSFQDIWSDLDSTKISVHHTRDYLLLEHGEVWNNDTIRNYMRRALIAEVRSKRENKFEFIKVERYGNSAWIAYDNFATWSINGEINSRAHWLESAVATKTREGWKIKMLHSTRVQNER